MRKILLTILLVVTYFSVLKIFKNFYVADNHYKKSQKIVRKNEPDQAIYLASVAIEKNKNEPRYYLGRAKVYLAATISTANIEYKSLALADLEKAKALNPNNLVTIKNSVFPYYLLSLKDLSKPVNAQNIDQDFIENTKAFYSATKEKYKTDVGVYTLIAKYESKLGLLEEFEDGIEKVEILRPDLLQWHDSFNVR